MAIPEEEVAQVRAATDIVALIGEQVALRHQGRRWVGLCPFHGEKTASFSVNAEEGLYYCFGCQASGDAITFVRAIETLDFAEAVRRLASRAGITLHEGTGKGSDSRWRGELLDAMERAVTWYHERLLSAPDAGAAREYLRSRGYDGAVVRKFRLGWAPGDWDALSTSLKLSEKVLTDTGLGFVNRRGRRQDAFRGRIIFPICDPSDHPVALGGRILPPRPGAQANQDPSRGPEPKYKNSQETIIYSKRRTLYGLNWAKKDVVATGEVVVCEGYTDVIGFFQAGVERAVATCGTALAEEHFRLLRNFGRKIVLAYDADSAGETATARVYEWERKHEVDVAVATLPAGTDPGELAMRDPKALAEAVANSRPFLQFRLDRVLQGAELSTPEGRAKAAEAAIGVIAEHPDDLVRDQYAMTVSDWCRLEPDTVRRRLEDARRRPAQASEARSSRTAREPDEGPRRAGPERGPSGGREPIEPFDEERGARARPNRTSDQTSRPGLEALRLAVHRPEAVADRIEGVLFTDELQRRAFLVLAEADNLHEAIDGAPPDVADLLRRVAVEEPVISEETLRDPVDAVVAQLVREATKRALLDLEIQTRTGPEGIDGTHAEMATVKRWLDKLDDDTVGSEASRWLLAWLLDRRRED
jgi:DNA primase